MEQAHGDGWTRQDVAQAHSSRYGRRKVVTNFSRMLKVSNESFSTVTGTGTLLATLVFASSSPGLRAQTQHRVVVVFFHTERVLGLPAGHQQLPGLSPTLRTHHGEAAADPVVLVFQNGVVDLVDVLRHFRSPAFQGELRREGSGCEERTWEQKKAV